VLDVAVDVRAGSDTWLHWHAIELSPEANLTFAIPAGFAHGFQALEPNSELLYLHTGRYDPANERGLSPRDPAVAINWPVPIEHMSDRDHAHSLIDAEFGGVEL